MSAEDNQKPFLCATDRARILASGEQLRGLESLRGPSLWLAARGKGYLAALSPTKPFFSGLRGPFTILGVWSQSCREREEPFCENAAGSHRPMEKTPLPCESIDQS